MWPRTWRPVPARWPTQAGARRAVVEYIAWYNGTRLHSSLGHQSPADYENNHHDNVRQVT
jgi:putative transposase